MKSVKRCEDMRPIGKGWLEVFREDDGDMIVVVSCYDGELSTRSWKQASIQFCTIGSGGGKSPRTLEALYALMAAIEEDNKNLPLFDRDSEEHQNHVRAQR
jgi:hypothetical protein